MSICKYCGQKAGFFKNVHSECELLHSNGKTIIVNDIYESLSTSPDLQVLESEIKITQESSFITPSEMSDLYVLAFDKTIDTFLDDGVISTEEESKIVNFKDYFNLDQDTLDKNNSYQKLIKGLILRDVFEGNYFHPRVNYEGAIPFILEKDENILWIFQNVEFYEQRTKTTFEGRSQGVSIKIAKGVYYRTGNFKGNPVTNTQMTLLGSGLLALTNRNLYFSSSTKNLKTPFKKLISLTEYSDGIGLQKDGTSAKPQIFKNIDGWFAYNFISHLSSN